MPIGGGTFTVQNKTLPGAYINFISLGNAASLGERGITALPITSDWGPENKVFSVSADDFNQTASIIFGREPTSPSLLLVREALKRARTLLCYRVNSGGDKAALTLGGLCAEALYGGSRGNTLRVAIEVNALDDDFVDVITYLGTSEVDTQTVHRNGGAEELSVNNFLSFSGSGELTPTAAVPLTGGTNGAVTGASFAAWLSALEVEAFSTVGYPGKDESVKALLAAFVSRLRENEGRKVVGVLHDFRGDSLGLINVKNGVILSDGSVLDGADAVAWVAGASAGADINRSLTNTAYDGAVDVDTRYSKSQLEAAIAAGEFVFYSDCGKARVLTDINCLTTFTQGVSADWTSNRVVRVMDGWASDVARIFSERYIGLVTNNETGRQLFKADLVSLGTQYEAIDALSGFSADDIIIVQGVGKRDVSVTCALMPNDSMEKLYMTVSVS